MVISYRKKNEGFALPTVVIASLVLFAVLVATSSVVASTRVSLDTQYYEALATDATESGVAIASECLKLNGSRSTWGANQLTPATDCNGVVDTSRSQYIVNTTAGAKYRTTYTVDPIVTTGNGVQTLTVTGYTQLIRSANGQVWKTFKHFSKAKIGGQISTTQVVFGYVHGKGAFFGTINANNTMRTVGYNASGQLGNGNTNSTLTPTTFILPQGLYAIRGYTSFLSVGFNMIVVASDGSVWAAGVNQYGQVGSGSPMTNTTIATPEKVKLPAGVSAKNAVVGQVANYIIGSDNNVYSFGSCKAGLLGDGLPISGCSDSNVPKRVTLPTVSADSNTIPVEISTDAQATYVRMAGGAVYGWGSDWQGQMGNDSFANTSTPGKIGTYGDAGKPKALQAITDGDTLYILDDSGQVNSVGRNAYGSMGTATVSLFSNSNRKCINNTNSDGVSLQLTTCNSSAAQKFQVRKNDTIYNAQKNVCMENTNGDGSSLRLAACSGTSTQQFVWDPRSFSLKNPATGKCIEDTGGTGTSLKLAVCDGNSTWQQFIGHNTNLTPFSMTGISGIIKKIWTDQWSLTCMTDQGEVWSAGVNISGQFGDKTTNDYYNPTPIKFVLPTGVTAKDIFESSMGSTANGQNIFVIGSNGKVYGAGHNGYGQLGNGAFQYDAIKTPQEMTVINGTDIVASQVQSGYGTTVIYTTDRSVYTVGNNSDGQLGNGNTTNLNQPTKAQYTNPLSPVIY